MFTYRDMTFCNCTDCITKDCNRKLTDEVKKLSRKFKLPIAYSDDYYKNCDKYTKNDEDYLTEH